MLGGIVKYWQQIAVGVLVLVLAFYIGTLKVQLGNARGEVAELRGQLAESMAAYEILSKKTVEQSAAIAEWEARAKTASTKAAEAIKKAKAMAEHRQGEISRLKASIKAGGASCAEAVKEIRESLP
jgi:predicted  nucleic acid-binding Zn-ribbon protein